MEFDVQRCRENLIRREAAQHQHRETRRQAARTAILTAIQQVVPIYSVVQRVYLFGSITQAGRFRDSSDIDIAVEGTDAAAYFTLWRDLEAACPGWMIDLRELDTPSHFTNTVRQYGELVYENPGGTSEGNN